MGRKKPKQKENATSKKRPREAEDAESYLKNNPVWKFKLNDKNHGEWSIRNCCDFNNDVMDKLQDFEGMTWSEIINTNGIDTSHFVNTSDLIKKAQDRLRELRIIEDRLFSLRLNGKTRIYGLLNNGIFNILWYDCKHEIYPSKKKNT